MGRVILVAVVWSINGADALTSHQSLVNQSSESNVANRDIETNAAGGPGEWWSQLRGRALTVVGGATEDGAEFDQSENGPIHWSKNKKHRHKEDLVEEQVDPRPRRGQTDLESVGTVAKHTAPAHHAHHALKQRLDREDIEDLQLQGDDALWRKLVPQDNTLDFQRRSCEKLLAEQEEDNCAVIDQVEPLQKELEGLHIGKTAIKELHQSNVILKKLLQTIEGKPLSKVHNITDIVDGYAFDIEAFVGVPQAKTKEELHATRSRDISELSEVSMEAGLKKLFLRMYKRGIQAHKDLKTWKAWLVKSRQSLADSQVAMTVERGQLSELRLKYLHRLHNIQLRLRSIDTDIRSAELATEPRIALPNQFE